MASTGMRRLFHTAENVERTLLVEAAISVLYFFTHLVWFASNRNGELSTVCPLSCPRSIGIVCWQVVSAVWTMARTPKSAAAFSFMYGEIPWISAASLTIRCEGIDCSWCSLRIVLSTSQWFLRGFGASSSNVEIIGSLSQTCGNAHRIIVYTALGNMLMLHNPIALLDSNSSFVQ